MAQTGVSPAYWLRFAVAMAAVWAASLALTHGPLKRLHSAGLAGPDLLDNREADALLRAGPLPKDDALLVLRAGHLQSIATLVFYSRLPVALVFADSGTPTPKPNRYQPRAASLAHDSLRGVFVLLIDKSLLDTLPLTCERRTIRASEHLELDEIVFQCPSRY